MRKDLEERLKALNVSLPSDSERHDVLAAVWLASCRHDHMWSWPYRTGEGLENVFHVHFVEQPESTTRTFLNINADWLALTGAHATPVRTLRLTDAAADEFIDTVVRAMEAHSVRVWTWFGDWWIPFRAEHSELHAAPDLGSRPTAEHAT